MNVLIIGLGSIAKKHIHSILSIDAEAKIMALRSNSCSPSIEDVKNIYSIEEIKGPLDFAIISNPTSEHIKWIMQLSGLTIPLFIEKPLSSSLDIEKCINIISKKKIITYVACNLRFLDCIRFVKDYISENPNIKINEINSYCGSYLPNWRKDKDYRNSYSSNFEMGGGVHLDLIHELDYIYWLFGKPLKVAKTLKKQSSLKINSIDYAHYLLEYNEFCVSIVLNYFRRDSKRTLEIVFEEDTWMVNLLTNSVYNYKGEKIFSSTQQIADTYYAQMSYFINEIKTKDLTMNSIYDAYQVLKICLE